MQTDPRNLKLGVYDVLMVRNGLRSGGKLQKCNFCKYRPSKIGLLGSNFDNLLVNYGLLLAVLRMGEVGLSSDEYGLALGTSPTPYPVIFKFLICPFVPF